MSNIPSFNDVCGTVVESLAETIQNREKIIIQLREDNARLQRNVVALQNEVEACGGDERKIVFLEARIRNLHDEIRNLEQTAETTYEDHRRIVDELITQRDEARMEVCTLSGNGSCDSTEREADSRGWDCFKTDSDLAMEDAYLRKEREAESDSDPATGVQYGDLN